MNIKFFEIIRSIDSILSNVISEDDQNWLIENLKFQPLLQQYFVTQANPAKIYSILEKMDYFDFKFRDTDGYYYWPPTTYLFKLIELNEQEKAWSIIKSLPPFENISLHQEFTKLILKMPDSYFLDWMGTELKWFDRSNQLDLLNIDIYMKAIERVWNLGNVTFCYELLYSLLAVRPDASWDYENGKLLVDDNYTPWRTPEPALKFSEYNYLEILSYFAPILEKYEPLRFIHFLSKLLEDLLKFGVRSWEETNEFYLDDQSYITRPSIWDHPQNYNHRLTDKLVPLLRDAMLDYIKDKNTFGDIVEILKPNKWVLFQRFYIFVIGREGRNRNPSLIDEVLYNQKYAEDDCFGNEYHSLLSQNYANLSKEEQIKYVDWLDKWAIELEEKYKQEHQSKEVQENKVLNEMYDPKHRIDLFFYRILPALQGYLPPDKEKYLDELKNKFSKSLVKPEFPHYHESFVGPISPLENQDISVLSVRELIQKMIEFQMEEDGWNEPSPEGFARQISRDVEINPFKYLDSISIFCNEQIPKRYLSALLWGFRSALDNGKTLKSDVLCQYLEFLFDLIKTKAIEETLNLQHTLASFLRTIFEKKIVVKTDFERFAFLNWISILLHSSSPDEVYEEKGEDFVSKGINSVRGNGLHSLVYYLIDYYQKFLKEGALNVSEEATVNIVYSILKDHFDGEFSIRKTDRCVLGQHFAFLYWLNPNWFRENEKLIFNDNLDLGRVFFHTYIQYGAYSKEIYERYKERFIESIEYLSELGDKAREERGIRPFRVGELLLNLYGNEVISSCEDPILTKFFELPQGFLKANAIRFLGVNVPKDQPLLLERAETLWNWRLREGPSPEEFETFSEWIERGVYSEGLIFETLKNIKSASLRSYGIESYFRFVKEKFSINPIVSIQFLNEATQENSYHWNARPEDDLWEILKMGIQCSDATVKDIAVDITHRLGSYGYFQYRELLGI